MVQHFCRRRQAFPGCCAGHCCLRRQRPLHCRKNPAAADWSYSALHSPCRWGRARVQAREHAAKSRQASPARRLARCSQKGPPRQEKGRRGKSPPLLYCSSFSRSIGHLLLLLASCQSCPLPGLIKLMLLLLSLQILGSSAGSPIPAVQVSLKCASATETPRYGGRGSAADAGCVGSVRWY